MSTTPAENLFAIPNLLETGVDEVEHAILYGETGSGKTVAASMLAEFYNILFFNGDKGLTAAKYNCHPDMLKRIHVITIPDTPEYPTLMGTMLRVVRGTDTLICITHGLVDCVICKQNKDAKQVTVNLSKLPKNWIAVFDSQTQLYTSILNFAYYKESGKAPGSGVPPEYKGNWDYRGIAYNCAEMFGNYVKDLKCQWISISHETMVEMEDNTSKLVPVGGSRNVSSNYGRWFGTQVYAKKQNGKHNFMTASTYSGSVQTKSRTNVRLEEQVIPSLVHIFNPEQAKELLKGSFNEWFFTEGFKDISKRTKGKELSPKPKEVITLT
jgi:hypothetical protein